MAHVIELELYIKFLLKSPGSEGGEMTLGHLTFQYSFAFILLQLPER